MNFTVILHRSNPLIYSFDENQFNVIDDSEEEPISIYGEVFIDGNKIGELTLYELNNDKDFLIYVMPFPKNVQLWQKLYVENQVLF